MTSVLQPSPSSSSSSRSRLLKACILGFFLFHQAQIKSSFWSLAALDKLRSYIPQKAVIGGLTLYATQELFRFLQSHLYNMCNFRLVQLRTDVYTAGSKLPRAVRKKLLKEINDAHFTQTPYRIAEVTEFVSKALRVPWKTMKTPQTNIRIVENALNTSIFGMKDAKDAILDIIFAYNSGATTTFPPICLVGPPGVGKTAFALAVAKALNLPSIIVSASGMSDPDTFFRGHNQSYKAAAPGFFITNFTSCGCKNPVVVIDEIDKEATGNDRGTIQNILLQVFDGIQNKKFRDNFLEMEIDVSNVIYIVTANDRKNITGPLQDRMIMIEVENYSEKERSTMAQTILWATVHNTHKISEKVKKQIVEEALAKTEHTKSIRDLKKHLSQSTLRWLRTH